jgi:hypothetical protein
MNALKEFLEAQGDRHVQGKDWDHRFALMNTDYFNGSPKEDLTCVNLCYPVAKFDRVQRAIATGHSFDELSLTSRAAVN